MSDIKKELQAFRTVAISKGWDMDGETTSSNFNFYSLQTRSAWESWQAAKAQAVPENKIEFDGEYIKYPNSYAIHCQFDEDFDCHIFDVYQNEDCVKDGMTQLKQAHLFVFSMSEALELENE